ncbi:hypothetical protein RLDS_16195 [Sphingobium lactosutens DS20]|uniref:Uncharacterized protein n=2 Tax=Sphingobium TaxID=165695 RepID=T0HJU3_9SPHN|nr:hypothetical protein RLDS_16195 [Sphingobium lactosutens DS20]
MDGSLWSLAIVGGPIMLGLVLIFVIVGNKRRRNPGDVERTEAATADLYKEMDARDKGRDNG